MSTTTTPRRRGASCGAGQDPAQAALLAEGYRTAARLTRAHGTTYYWGARLLPREQRRHVFAVYGLARTADDLVDEPGGRGPDAVAAALHALEREHREAMGSGRSSDPVVLASATSARGCGIPEAHFARFFAAMRQDLTTTSYATWADLLGYMDGSAAVIGEMMLPVLEPDPRSRAASTPAARALGLAFQLTNFLRDVGEDLDRGRVYLPREDLDHFGVDLSQRSADESWQGPWRALMRFEVERNRRLYREADAGLAALPLGARRCVTAARVLYARILERIEAQDLDVFAGRARVARRHKAGVAARVLRSPSPEAYALADGAVHPVGSAIGAGEGWPDDDHVVLLDAAGRAVGEAPKSQVHHDDTPLHLAFSCYVVDPRGRVLVTTRAHGKASFPGVVTNSACGHPRPGEPLEEAVRRRVRHELGLEIGLGSPGSPALRVVLPDYGYRARTDRLVEHERCPVLVASVDRVDPPTALHPGEVADAQWWEWPRLVAAAADPATGLSPWCREQVALLARLGDDPRRWPEGDPRLLPAALDVGVPHRA